MSDMKFWLVAILALIAFPVVFAEKGTFVDQVQFIQYLDENTALEEVRNGNLTYTTFVFPQIELRRKRPGREFRFLNLPAGHIAY